MRAHLTGGDEIPDLLAARTAELHRTAYLLTADQDRAEHLVETVIGDLSRHGVDTGRAETTSRHHMARMAGAVAIRPAPDEDTREPPSAITRLSPRERAVLMLRSIDGYDRKSTALVLGLSRSKAAAAEESASQSLGFDIADARMRLTLTDFSEQATWPHPDTTWTRSARAEPPRRRSRKRYVAVAAVLALTVAAPIGSQVQHNQWLRTPAGINATHGTHFHAYTQGYKLVGVERVPPGATRKFRLPADDAVALTCAPVLSRADEAKAPVLFDGTDTSPGICDRESADRYDLMPATSVMSVHTKPGVEQPVFVATYEPVEWDDYPVATHGFQVQHNQTVTTIAQLSNGHRPVRPGKTLTMHGTNGVFTARVERPAATKDTDLVVSVLLSPTTTGWYRVIVDGQPMSNCSVDTRSEWCLIYDHHVPQVWEMMPVTAGEFTPEATEGAATVTVEVRHALGPWKLEVRYDRYKSSN